MEKELLGFKIDPERKRQVEAMALAKNETKSKIVQDALDLYLTFPPGFIEEMEKQAKNLNMPLGIVLSHLLCAYTAQEAAIIAEGMNSGIHEYAFRYDEKGLIHPNDAGVLTFKEVRAKIQKIKRRRSEVKRTGKSFTMDGLEAGLMSHAL